MPRTINDRYRKAAEEFARRVVAALGKRVDSIVLFGSVARGKAKRDSDVDILVISPNPEAIRAPVSQICSDFSYESNYTFFISLVHLGDQEFAHLRQLGSPFIKDVITQGVILYDNGTFTRVSRPGITVS